MKTVHSVHVMVLIIYLSRLQAQTLTVCPTAPLNLV